MASQDIQHLYNQSNAIEAKLFWEELEIAIGRALSSESVLDFGCSYPELFIYLFRSYPEKLKSYWGIEKLSKGEVEMPANSKPLPKVFSIEYSLSIEDFTKWYIPEKFSCIFLKNVLHFVAPEYDDAILSFLRTHLMDNGIIYIEAIPQTSSINHGRPYPFDKRRYEKYLHSMRVVSYVEYGEGVDVLKAILKFVE